MPFSFIRRATAGCLLSVLTSLPLTAQVPLPSGTYTPADTTRKYVTPPSEASAVKTPWYKGKLVKATIVPAVLIGYGVSTIRSNGFYSSYEAQRDIQRQFPGFRTKADDYLLAVPYLELGVVALAGVESRNDRLNTLLVIAKSELIMGALVLGLKNTTNVLRPDGSNRESFPSGHTAQAFLAASIVHTEFRNKSQWYGVGAYTVATSVAALRMLNNRHWQSDVFAGAGIGILSAHLGYLTHRNRWGRKPLIHGVGASPMAWPGGTTGLTLTWRAH